MKTKNSISAFIICLSLAACGKKAVDTGSNAYNNGYYPNGSYPGGVGGCIPLNQQLSFSAQGASINDISVLAGNMPQNSNRPGNYGQVMMGAGGYMGGYGFAPGTITMSKSGANGSISMMVTAPTYQTYVTTFPGVPATIQGTIQLSQQVMQALQASSGYLSMPFAGMPYGQVSPYNGYQSGYNMYPQANCITSVGFQAVGGITPSLYGQPGNASIYQVLMYLYMNNGSAPTPIIL